MQAEVARDKLAKVNRNATDRLEELEQDRKDLADEYVVLKTNYLALTKEHEREVRVQIMLKTLFTSNFANL